MWHSLQLFRYVLRYFGPGWIIFRVWYAFKKWITTLSGAPRIESWDFHPLDSYFTDPSLAVPETYLDYRRSQAPRFFFSPDLRASYSDYFAHWDTDENNSVAEADRIVQGEFRYFFASWIPAGIPPEWHTNPFTKEHAPPDRHWTRIDDFSYGDIKAIWEINRFGFVYTLVRAYWRTGDKRYPEVFWTLIENWHDENPPLQGPNWKCGQETSFRVMAWCFGLYGFLNCDATSPARVHKLAGMIAVSGERIASHIDYARSQQNNHIISEGMGLWTIGILFPEFRHAGRWLNQGSRVLESSGENLIYDDGAFVQHSLNYHRLMLHDYVWAYRLGSLNGKSLSDSLLMRLERAGALLYQLQDKSSGHVPRYGQNDSTLILPLNDCDYQDFRSVIQSIHYLCNKTRCYPPGLWDEDLLWLWGPEALSAPEAVLERSDLQSDLSGYYVLRASDGFLFTRCGHCKHRPGQADMLHADIWWRGQNIAIDPGTFSYNAPKPWGNPLAHTAYHNTVTVDNLDQMDRMKRFMWLPWLRGTKSQFTRSSSGALVYWEGFHDGYRRLKPPVHHHRGIARLGDETWLIVDRLQSRESHTYRLHWLLEDFPYSWDETGRLNLETSQGMYTINMAVLSGVSSSSLVHVDPNTPRGWQAPYYYSRKSAISVDLVQESCETWFWTLFSPLDRVVTHEEHSLTIRTNLWTAQVSPGMDEKAPLIRRMTIDGSHKDNLDLPS